MDSNFDEKEIGKIFETYRLKKPPEPLMKDFESEVWKKIKTLPAGPGLGFGIGLSAVFLLALLFVFFIWIRPALREPVGAALRGRPLNGESSTQGRPHRGAPTESDALPRNDGVTESDFAQMAEDLLILEMLGEDEGLLDDFERLEADREFFIGTGSGRIGTVTAG